jgi:hypothetical protein
VVLFIPYLLATCEEDRPFVVALISNTIPSFSDIKTNMVKQGAGCGALYMVIPIANPGQVLLPDSIFEVAALFALTNTPNKTGHPETYP